MSVAHAQSDSDSEIDPTLTANWSVDFDCAGGEKQSESQLEAI